MTQTPIPTLDDAPAAYTPKAGELRPHRGFIRPDGTWLVGDHRTLAAAEMRRRRWTVSAEVRALPSHIGGGGAEEVLELERRGYVRVIQDGCNFELWRTEKLSRAARAEMELTFLGRHCRHVHVDEVEPLMYGPKSRYRSDAPQDVLAALRVAPWWRRFGQLAAGLLRRRAPRS